MSGRRGPLNVAIVGLAHLHPQSYMRTFEQCPQTRVVAAMDPDARLRRTFCRRFGIRGYASLAGLLAGEKIDVAAIFLPHADCPTAAVRCARHGIHLMVEKPMAATAAGARRVVRAAREHGVKLTTGYIFRMHPAAREIRKLLRRGLIGRVLSAEGRFAAGGVRRYVQGGSPWMLQRKRSGGGPLHNLGVHWIDLFSFLLGDRVAEVSGRTVRSSTGRDIEDGAFAHLRFRSGAILALEADYLLPRNFPGGRDWYVALRGTKGAIWWVPQYAGTAQAVHLASEAAPARGGGVREIKIEVAPAPGYSNSMGRDYVRSFVRSIRGDSPPPITGEDGVAALEVVKAVYESARRKRWVKVVQPL